jgi:hypothetical protein
MPSPMMNSEPRKNQSGSSTIDHGQLMTPASLSPISGNCTMSSTPPTEKRHRRPRRQRTDTRGPDVRPA